MKTGHKVAVGWLSPGQVDSAFAMSMAVLYRERPRIEDLFCDENSGLLSRGRNMVAANFLQHSTADWLLMIDSDQQLSVGGFDKLCDAAHHLERPIVAGLYFGAWSGAFYPTAVPLIFRDHPTITNKFAPIVNYPRDQVIEVDSAGTGCLMVHRSVFERIRESDQNPQDPDGRWCWFRDMPVAGDWYSEDHFFCSVARENGFKLHAHTGVVLPHRKRFWLDERHHLLNNPDMLTDEERRSPQWAPLAGAVETTEEQTPRETAALRRPARVKPTLRPVPDDETESRGA